MKKSTGKTFLAVVIGAGILYFILNSQKVGAFVSDVMAMTGGAGGAPTVSNNETPLSQDNTKAINKLNKDASVGALERTSQTNIKGLTATGGSGSSFSGQTLKGNIATLGTGKTVFVATQQPSRDVSGKTQLDKIIEKNKAKLKK